MTIPLQLSLTSIFILALLSEQSFVSSLSAISEETVTEAEAVPGVVFHYRPEPLVYFMDFEDAIKACQDAGARIADRVQVQEAGQNGLHLCHHGWLSDKTIQYSIAKPNKCHGFNQVGVLELKTKRPSSRSDVFCFAPQPGGMVFLSQDPDGLTYSGAYLHCQSLRAELATPGQLSAAWKDGLDECRPGWLKDGTVRYPKKISTAKCGGGQTGATYSASYETAFPQKHFRLPAYCFRGSRITVEIKGDRRDGMGLVVMNEASVTSGQVMPYQWIRRPERVAFKDAHAKCKEAGAQLASLEQLIEANKNGLHQCLYGWVKEELVKYSEGITGCPGNDGTGMGVKSPTKPVPYANVYCFIGPLTGNVFFIDGKFDFGEGYNECKKKGSAVATPAQLSAAWKKGLNECREGWLANKSIRFVVRITTNSCGGGASGANAAYQATYQVGFSHGRTLHGVYCHAQ